MDEADAAFQAALKGQSAPAAAPQAAAPSDEADAAFNKALGLGGGAAPGQAGRTPPTVMDALGRTNNVIDNTFWHSVANLVGAPGGLTNLALRASGLDNKLFGHEWPSLGPTRAEQYLKDWGFIKPKSEPQPGNLGENLLAGTVSGVTNLPFGAGLGEGRNVAYSIGPGLLGKLFGYFGIPGGETIGTLLGAGTTAVADNALTNMQHARQLSAVYGEARNALDRFESGKGEWTRAQNEQQAQAQAQADARRAEALARAQSEHDAAVKAAGQSATNATNYAQMQHAVQHAMADQGLGDIADQMGRSSDFQQFGESAQKIARAWLEKDFPAQLDTLDKARTALMPKDTVVDLPNFSDKVAKSDLNAGSLQKFNEFYTPRAASAMAAKLKAPEAAATSAEDYAAEPSVERTLSAPLSDVLTLRSNIGRALGAPEVAAPGTTDIMNKELHGALTQDVREAAKAQGPEALKTFDKFNEEATRLYGLREGPVARVIDSTNAYKENIDPEKVFGALTARNAVGGSVLQALRSEPGLAPIVDELGAAILRNKPEMLGKAATPYKIQLFGSPERAQAVDALLGQKTAADEALKAAQQGASEAESAAKTQAGQTRRQLEQGAQTLHAGDVGEAQAAREEANIGRGERSYDLNAQVRNAKDKLQEAAQSNKPSALELATEGFSGLGLGPHLNELMASAAPAANDLTQGLHAAHMTDLGYALGPIGMIMAGQAARALYRHPEIGAKVLQSYLATNPWRLTPSGEQSGQ